jgi:sarcosine oxidase
MGSAAAWQLSLRGHDVLLLEQFEAGHTKGASHGSTRNFNNAYPSLDWVALVSESRRHWDQLSEVAGTPLLDLVGLVNHGWSQPLRTIRETHREAGVDSDFISPAEASSRWQGMRFRSDVLYVPEAGRVRSAQALIALRMASEKLGAEFRYETPVLSIAHSPGGGAIVVTEEEEIEASHVVITAGAWSSKLTNGLLPLPPLRVTQEQPAHFEITDPDAIWPSFNHTPDPDVAEDRYWLSETYGMLTPGEGVKVGWHGVGPETDPDARSYEPEPSQEAALRRYAREWLPGVDADSYSMISCTYTSTTSEDFVIDRSGPFVIGAGFSGKGFKFTPTVGRILADIVDGLPTHPLFSMAAHQAATA